MLRSLQGIHKAVQSSYKSIGLTLFAVGAAQTNFHSSTVASCSEKGSSDGEQELIALNPKEWRPFKVQKVQNITPNTVAIEFEFPSKDHVLGLPVASCLMARAIIEGQHVARPYTPTSTNSDKGMMELVVKGYEQGLLSKHIVNLKPGDILEMKGPFKKYPYQANEKKCIGMIAGGSGLTPMLQVIHEIVRNHSDQTEIRLLFANVTEEDIILRDHIDALRHLHPHLKVKYCLDSPPENWDGLSGYITKEMLEDFMPSPSDENLVLVCGPPPMMYHVSGNKAKDKSQGDLQGLLKDLNYTSSMVFKF